MFAMVIVDILIVVLQTKTCSPYESCTDNLLLHRKKGFSIFPSPAGMSLTKFFLGGNNLYMTSLFPPRESLVKDIPAGEGNIEKLFYGVFKTLSILKQPRKSSSRKYS